MIFAVYINIRYNIDIVQHMMNEVKDGHEESVTLILLNGETSILL